MSLVLEPEEEAALFLYIIDGCKVEKPINWTVSNYLNYLDEYDRSGCKVTIPAIIEKYGKVVNDMTYYRGHGKFSFEQTQRDADRIIAPGMASKKFFSVSWDIGSAKTFTGRGCCLFEITLKNAKLLQLDTVSFERSFKGGLYPPEKADEVDKERARRNENLMYLLNYDHEVLVLGGGEFTPLGEPVMKGKTLMYSTTYTGKTMGGRRRRTYRRKRKTTSS